MLATITIVTLYWVCNNTHNKQSRAIHNNKRQRRSHGRRSQHHKVPDKQTSSDIPTNDSGQQQQQQQQRLVYIKDVTRNAIKTTSTSSLSRKPINQQENNAIRSSSSHDHLEMLHYQQKQPRMQIAPENSILVALQTQQKPILSSQMNQMCMNDDNKSSTNGNQAFDVRCKCVKQIGASYAASGRFVESSLSQQSLSDVLFIQTPSPMAGMMQSNNNQQIATSSLWTKQASKPAGLLLPRKQNQQQQHNQTSELNSFGEPFGTDETSSVNHDDSFVIITPNGIDNNHYRQQHQHQATHLTLVKSPGLSSMESPTAFQSNADKNNNCNFHKSAFRNVDHEDGDHDDDNDEEDQMNEIDKGFHEASYITTRNDQLIGQIFLYDDDNNLQTTSGIVQPKNDCQGKIIVNQEDIQNNNLNNATTIQRRKSGDRVRFLIDDDWS